MASAQIKTLCKSLKDGDIRALAKSITLVESSLPEDRAFAEELLSEVITKSPKSIRVGFSGMPGVGKSSLIESFGLHCIQQGHKLAVLAIDPTSPLTGGSILGDKTRMEQLSRHQSAFIRPSPSGKSTGGVARNTREAILLCEAAGFDFIIVETVGVGQAEYSVASMVDTFAVMQLPGSGDELQGIKKGILELADILIINKADSDMLAKAEQARNEFERAFMLVRSGNWTPPILLTSAIEGRGVKELYDAIQKHNEHQKKQGEWTTKRQEQARTWFQQELSEQLREWIAVQPKLAAKLKVIEDQVSKGSLPASVGVKNLLENISTSRA